MKALMIKDLSVRAELDAQAMAAVVGGADTAYVMTQPIPVDSPSPGFDTPSLASLTELYRQLVGLCPGGLPGLNIGLVPAQPVDGRLQ